VYLFFFLQDLHDEKALFGRGGNHFEAVYQVVEVQIAFCPWTEFIKAYSVYSFFEDCF